MSALRRYRVTCCFVSAALAFDVYLAVTKWL
jgi:hypothetical protein